MDLVMRRITKKLEKDYVPHIDVQGADKAHQLSRATTALSISIQTGADEIESCSHVTDHGKDQGIDGVAIYSNGAKLLLVQSKYTEGNGGIDLGSVTKFIRGVRKLAQADWAGFGGPILRRQTEIENIITNFGLEIVLVVSTTSDAPISIEASEALKEVCTELGGPSQARWDYFNRTTFDSYLNSVQKDGVDLEVSMLDWGQHSVGGLTSYFGTLTAETVIEWNNQFKNLLFARNIRSGLGSNEVNDQIADAARHEPEQFWFYNNGITVLAEAVETPQKANRTLGKFKFLSASVVNGAQTITSLARASGNSEQVKETAQIFAKFIIVGSENRELARKITRRTNTQNRVGDREFVSLDPLQDSIRRGFLEIDKSYVYRSGEYIQSPDRECDLTEATIALACSAGIDETVLAKGTIGRLWADTTSAPYTSLFLPNISAQGIWNRVLILRAVERSLVRMRPNHTGRDRLVLTHGNRMILWATLIVLAPPAVTSDKVFAMPADTEIAKLVRSIAKALIDQAAKLYPDSYPAPLFKNREKCRNLAAKLSKIKPLSSAV
jgi:AIPR protein